MQEKKHNILPFFKTSLAYTILYLAILLVLPISHLFYNFGHLTWDKFITSITNDRVISAYKLTFTSAFIAGISCVIIGMIITWTITRYKFYGKQLLDIFIDLPLALPTAIAGLSLANLYAHDAWFGKILKKIGIEIIFTKTGIIIALIFVGLPFVIRTLEPVIREIDEDVELAASSLGASSWQIFWRIYLPSFTPSLFSAFSIAFARSLSEYGAVIFVASNIPKESEIISLLIYSKIEQFDYNQATAIAAIMMLISFFILWSINIINKRATS